MLRATAALIALTACGSALGPVPSAGRGAVHVRLATWNVHDLFDSADQIVPPGAEDLVPAEAEVEAKLARVASVLERLDADLVLLEEVENRPLLDRLAALAGYPAARLVEGNDPRGIDVAVLSRLPLGAYESHAAELGPDGRLLWPRDCVVAHAVAGGRDLVVVGSHFSSALSDDGTRRAWQAARMREIADAAAAGGAIVLAGGDLNDAPASAALAPLLADGEWVDPAPAEPTWVGASRAERLDYLLVRADAAPAVDAAWIDSDPDVAAASDHRPVVLAIAIE